MPATTQPRTHRRSQIAIELATPRGIVFLGSATTVEISPATGTMQIMTGRTTYFGLVTAAQVTLRLGKHHRHFSATHAAISIDNRRVTVIAEMIQETTPFPENCANPVCRCGTENIRRRTPK
jgi:F0F1-type ATP synthase epsilon subunit